MSQAPIQSSAYTADEIQRQFVAWLRPSSEEVDYEVTEIDGEIPRELVGAYYRNGPSQHISPPQGSEALHLFDGDGLVQAFRFEAGRAWVQSAFVRNASFLAEEAEGRFCMNGLGVDADSPIEAGRVQSNTNVVFHGGKLLAMVENSFPVEIDPKTLATGSVFDFDDKPVGMSTSAHPKIDGRTGKMLVHGYQPVEPFASLYVVEPDGRTSLAETLETPWPSMMHDMAITENYVVLPLGPIFFDLNVMAEGGLFSEVLSWQPERGLKFGIRSREAGSPMRWFDAPTPGYMFHPGNAYEEDGVIYMDACTYLDGEGFLADLKTIRSGKLGGGLLAVPFLYEFDLRTGECRERQLTDRAAEFPRIDERRVGYKNRWGYAAVSREDAVCDVDKLFTGITRYDRTGGPSTYHNLPAGHWTGEPIFVPRSANAEEDDGFVLSLVHDGPNNRSGLQILDARNLGDEPLAQLWLRHHVPLGFHGNFVAGAA